jgi:hypothetical protein
MAECNSPIGDYSVHECNVAESLYNLEYESERVIDKFIVARGLMMELKRQPTYAKEYVNTDAQSSVQEMSKESKVITSIESAINSRFRLLQSNKQ